MLEVAEKDILRGLERDNPWWFDDGSTTASGFAHTRAYFGRFKELALNWEVRRALILMGPRRVGKTVMLEQLVEHALEEGFPAKCILLASLDTPLYGGMPLERLIALFEKRTGHAPSERRIIIFDEVQYLKDWPVHLKSLTDRFPNTRFIACVSARAALRLKSQESGAGRFTDFILPCLTLAEFLSFRGLEDKLIRRGQDGGFVTSDIDALNAAFVDYLNFGGYPEAVLDPRTLQRVQRRQCRDIVNEVLHSDMPNLYGIQDIRELNRLFATIAYHSGNEISLEYLASISGAAKNTIYRYLEYLQAAFMIVCVGGVDGSGRAFQRMRKFKAYLTNPTMRAALFGPLADNDEAFKNVAETAIASQWFHSDELRNLYYARWKSGRQDRKVDLVSLNPATLRPAWVYEIKWSDRFAENPGEMKGLIEFVERNQRHSVSVFATTRSKLAETTVNGVLVRQFPCALHCYQVGKRVIEGNNL